METWGDQGNIVSNPNGANADPAHVKPKASTVGDFELFIIHKLKLISRVDSSLLNSPLIKNWSHQGGGEL